MTDQRHDRSHPQYDDRNNLFARESGAPFDLHAWSSTKKQPPGTNIVQQHVPMAPMIAPNPSTEGHPPMHSSPHLPHINTNPGAKRKNSVASKSSQAHGKEGTPAVGDHNADPLPPWSDLKTKAGKDRKRLPLACIACRRKKIRCSGEKPACKHCLKSRTPCVYKVTTRKAAPRTDYMAMLDKRLKRMEERVIKALPKEDLDKLPEVTRAIVKPASAAHLQKQAKKRTVDEAFGNHLEKWADTPDAATPGPEARDATTAAEAREARRYPPPKQTTTEEKRALLTDGAEALPSKEIQMHLAEVYFDYVYGQSYHLLHKPSFMRRLELGNIPPVLILAVCAVSARFASHPALQTEPAFLRGEDWAKAALDVALRRFDSPNITILIVFVLLGLHTFGACQGGRSWMLGGMAQRMAYALQLHIDLDHDPLGQAQGQVAELSFTDREIRRRTMWAAFMMDRFNSSGTERPLFASEAGLQLQLPIKEKLFQMEIPGPTELLDGTLSKPIKSIPGQMSDPKANMGVAAYVVRLVWLWGRLVQYLNLGGKEKDQFRPWEPQSRFQELVKKIEVWEQELPTALRYNEENLKTHASEQTASQFCYMHIIYQQCMLFANQHAYPTTARDSTVGVPQANMLQGRKVALAAATRIAELIKDASEYRMVAPFAGYCAYSSSAVLIHGAFSRNPQLEATCKEHLTHNIIYLSKMKKYWGMFHFMTESLKDLYRQNADAFARGTGTNTPTTNKPNQKKVFQYGDWYDRYPNGVSQTDYEEPESAVKKEAGEDAVFSQKADLQSVDDFFATLSPTSRAKCPPKAGGKKGLNKSTINEADLHDDERGRLPPHLDASINPSIDSLTIPNSPYGIRESYSRTPVQARPRPAAPPPPQATQQALRPPQHHQLHPPPQHYAPPIQTQQHQPPIDPSILDLDRDPFAFAPPLYGSGLSQPGMLSQMDRHMVLQSYNGLDPNPSMFPNQPNSNAAGQPNIQDQHQQHPQQQQHQPFWPMPQDPADFFISDVNNNMSMMGAGAMGGAWMMPFNLDPPDFSNQAQAQEDFLGGFGLGNGQDPWFGLGLDNGGGQAGQAEGMGQVSQQQGQGQGQQQGQR